MPRILVHLRALARVAELDPAEARERTAALSRWRVRVLDARLSDAPFLTVEAKARSLDERAVDELKAALAALPAARPMLCVAPGHEVPLAEARLDDFHRAAGETPA